MNTHSDTTILEVDRLSHTYRGRDGDYVALSDISFVIKAGQIVSLVGPSGSGKSTTLRAISGLLKPTGGQVRLRGKAIDGVPRELAMVFQDYGRSLYPWMTVERNVAFPLLASKTVSKAEIAERVATCLEVVNLAGHESKYPWQLSGGMQQRVAIARAIAYRPTLLLMDEPFASVDAQTRSGLEDLVLDLRTQFDMTILFVTHDIDESVYLADRVVVLSKPSTTVQTIIDVPLGRERDQITTKEDPTFIQIRGEVARLVRNAAPGHELLAERRKLGTA